MLHPASLAPGLRRVILVVAISGLAGVLLAGIALPVTAGIGLTAREGAESFTERPGDYPAYDAAQRSVILDADGDPLATIYEQNRINVALDEIDPLMQEAMVAIEDSRFYQRGPIDFQGTLRAAMLNLQAGSTQAGGSTLTQQYVKLLRIDQATTDEQIAEVTASEGVTGYSRKLEELRMAVNVEKDLSKDEILRNYLNLAYFGQRAYGVQAAAQRYYSVSASELQSDQAAMLAGLVQAPAAYNPIENPHAALERRNVVLSRMLELGMLSQHQYDGAVERPLRLNPSEQPNGCVDSEAGFFCDYVVHEIQQMEALGDSPDERWQTLRTGGL
ncbi:MAG TPA: biosynthetic peptidoglycan transglycosylase, partial [Jiangellaceae bacterium]|nr:biosynthetic peptidoglycan transglycosylase [Jiangellaceae bacterium]